MIFHYERMGLTHIQVAVSKKINGLDTPPESYKDNNIEENDKFQAIEITHEEMSLDKDGANL